MKRLLLLIIISLCFSEVNTKAAMTGSLQSDKSSLSVYQEQTITARLKSSTRLFRVRYDLTSVIMIIPSGSVVTVTGSDSTYYKVKFNEDEGFIYRQDAEIVDMPVVSGKPVTNEQAVSTVRQNENKADRTEYLRNKYGQPVADKMIDHKIWKGMTAEMVIDSWGSPVKINRTINSDLVREEWIYKSTWLFIENNKLVEWGPVNK